MHAEDPRAVGRDRELPQGAEELLLRRRDERREVGRHAGLEQGIAGPAKAVGVGLEQIDAAEPVHLQIDEAGRGDSVPVRRREPIRGHDAVGDLDVTWDQPVADERSLYPEPHRSALRMWPPARSSCARAVSASTSPSNETIATFASPPAAASAASTASSPAPVARLTARRARALSFSLVDATSTIRSPYVFPRRIIERVEIEFSTSFCAVPALRRVDPATISGPTTTETSCSAMRDNSESGTETTQTVRDPATAAASSAPTTNGVRPLALTPTTASRELTRARTASAPASPSSSAASRSAAESSDAPATIAVTCPGSVEKVDSHSSASRAASRPEDPAPT